MGMLLLVNSLSATAADEQYRSVHLGFLHPNGVDVSGYSVEQQIRGKLYRFYTFGYPALAAIGIVYYDQFQGDGFTSTWGVGLGTIMYGSIGYQWKIADASYIKVGVGFATGIAYTGSFPVIAYEHRFLK